jgi:hypothetical protein
MISDKRRILIALLVALLIVYIIDSQNKILILEDTKLPIGMKKPGPKKTYDEFVKAANMDPNYKIGIPWINLIDATPYLPNYIKYKESLLLPVVNQDQCTSCWAISVAHLIGDRISLYTGGKIRRPLSYQELVSCFSVNGDIGCTVGGIPEQAYKYASINGLSTDEDYPYVQASTTSIAKCDKEKKNGFRTYVERGSVRSLCRNPDAYTEGSDKWKNIIQQNMNNMKTELFLNGPFCITIQVYKSLYEHDGLSIYCKEDVSGEYIGGHAAICIGMATEDMNGKEPGFDKSYYIIKNSWSSMWPMKSPASKGYFYIEAGKNVAGIESRASRALPVITDEIRQNMVKSLDESRYISYDDYVNDPERQNYITKSTRLSSMYRAM